MKKEEHEALGDGHLGDLADAGQLLLSVQFLRLGGDDNHGEGVVVVVVIVKKFDKLEKVAKVEKVFWARFFWVRLQLVLLLLVL